MKTLYVVRHAKSSWEDPHEADFDRPLNDRGKRDAPRMGKRLKEKEIHPDLMISSPAKRAWSTCKRIAEILDFPKAGIATNPLLYHAGEDIILKVVQSVKPLHKTLMIFGHNPGLTDFVNAIMKDESTYIDNIPTCGVVALSFDVEGWAKIEWKKGKLLFFDYPKSRD
jgi:phosphohistidine phosphatase